MKEYVTIDSFAQGMNSDDKFWPQFNMHRKLVNCRIDADGRLFKRPGYLPFCESFTARKFYGAHVYSGTDNFERILTVNDSRIVEFDPNIKTVKVAVSSRSGHFENALGACFFSNNSENRKGLNGTWGSWGISGPPKAATLGVSPGGTLDAGEYSIKYSYVEKQGSSRLMITNHDYLATISYSGPDGSGRVGITNIASSNNPRVTHKIIWATQKNDGDLYFLAEIENGVTSYNMDAEPSSDGLAYDDYADNSAIAGPFAWHSWNDERMWVIDSVDPRNLRASRRGTHYDLEYFPTSNLAGMSKSGRPIVFCFGLNGDQFAMTEIETVVLKGSDINGIPVEVARIGTINPHSWAYAKNGIIGLSSIGFVFFDGYNFYEIGERLYNLTKNDFGKTEGQGFVVEDAEYGLIYRYGAIIPPGVDGGVDNIPGYLPGSGKGGTGSGLPSDDFDDSSLNSGRWTEVSGNAAITETTALAVDKTDASVEDVYIKSRYSIDQNIAAGVNVSISAHTGTDHDCTMYLKLYHDASNYAEIGYRDVNGTLSIVSAICHAGAITADTVSSPPSNTIFRIRLIYGKVETLYKDGAGAWVYAGAVFGENYPADGWTVRIGVRTDSAGSAPTYTASFSGLRVQCENAASLENIIPENLALDNVNVVFLCYLRTWQPKIWDSANNEFLQPPWSYDTMPAQRFIKKIDGSVLLLDNTTGKCFNLDGNHFLDDQDLIPFRMESKIIDLIPTVRYGPSYGSNIKFVTMSKINGSWGMPFSCRVVAYPSMDYSEGWMDNYGGGKPMNAVQMQNLALANTEEVYGIVKFVKKSGVACQMIISKMDNDTDFSIRSILLGFEISGGIM